MKNKPHIVWIMCDQLRADAVGFMGNPIVRTPNLDRLAARGTVFENMFIQSPVCMTSRACIWTGRYLRNLGMANGCPALDPHEVTLPEMLQRAGYRTGLFGKLHLTPQQHAAGELRADRPIVDATPFLDAAGYSPVPEDPVKRNFGHQEVVPFEDDPKLWGAYREWLAARDPALAEKAKNYHENLWKSDFPNTPIGDTGVSDIPAALHPSMFLGDSAAEFFTRNHSHGPCFLNVSFVDPHHPWDPPREIAAHYPPSEMPLPKHADTGNVVWPPALAARMQGSFDYATVTTEQTRTAIAYYYAMVETADLAVGRLLDAIERAGEMENTIFVFVADHGEMNGSYGLWRKGSWHYDCMIRVPSFISAPGRIAGGRRVAGLTESIDLAPTVLGLIHQPVDLRMQGNDLSQPLLEAKEIGRKWVYTEMYTTLWGPWIRCWTLRTATAKLNYFPGERVGHLFDLATDPDERNDLWSSPAHRGLRDEMMANLCQSQHEQIGAWPRVMCQC